MQVVGVGRDVALEVSPPNLWGSWGSCKTCKSMFANVTRRARAVSGCCDLCLRLQLAMCLHVDWVMTSRRAFIRADALVAAPAIPGLSAPSSALYTQSQAARIAPRLSQTLAASVPSLPPLAGHHCASCCSEQQKQPWKPTALDTAHALNDSLPELASRP